MNMPTNLDVGQALNQLLARQKASFREQGAPSRQQREAQLIALKQALLSHQQAIVEALNADYGHRSPDDSRISDIMPCVNNINYTLKKLKGWMKPNRRNAGILLAPAKVQVQYQPLGVVGIIVPWNFPVMLSIGPLITALAAGNRAMIKLSEFTPETNRVLRQMLAGLFDETQVAVVEGEAEVAAAFSALPFDHLLFTGSTTVGRHVMRAAADNLTPVTLELGGKSPVIIAPDMPLDTAVERMIYGKCLNAGQICVAPDYVLLPKGQSQAFVQAFINRFKQMYGEIGQNPDYGAIINQRQFDRLQAVLQDAIDQGAKVTPTSTETMAPGSRKLPVQLITGVNEQMKVMQEEIFGPLLPIVEYDSLESAIEYVNDRPRPLALYIMSFDAGTQQRLLEQTHSGGVCINETVFHVAADDAPFGGIGPSGMGHYHGKEGFLTMSHAKTILSRGRLNTGKLVHPPYGKAIQQLLMKLFLR
ncbi:coniferyl aldehyde dehydrogenase [Shewanella halotolerans]|uniref:coniferyl aldehyde dehydrogenase n=1 Tax=Shewanella halotolerans TaxID=2864204 RepID=UPI001C6573A6|nr:coniferyl aldehyde dehydrogenase [Shewanella halotolerans]QYJ90781.1 coniferyl aldehyde dehydrogenase [Shewanella halotolerans]